MAKKRKEPKNPRTPAARQRFRARQIAQILRERSGHDEEWEQRECATEQSFKEAFNRYRALIRDDESLQWPVVPLDGGPKRHPLAPRKAPDLMQPDPFLINAFAFHLAIYELWTPLNQDEFRRVARRPAVRELLRRLPVPHTTNKFAAPQDGKALNMFIWMFPFTLDLWVRMPWVHPCRDGRGKASLNVGYAELTLDSYSIYDLCLSWERLLDEAMKARGVNARRSSAVLNQLMRMRRLIARDFARAERSIRRNGLLLRLDQLLQKYRPWLRKADRITVLVRLMRLAKALDGDSKDPNRCIEARLEAIDREFASHRAAPLYQEPVRSRAESDVWRLHLY